MLSWRPPWMRVPNCPEGNKKLTLLAPTWQSFELSKCAPSVKSLEAAFLAVYGTELSTKPCARPTIAPGYFIYKICAKSYGFAALKRRLAMVVGGILRHISSQTSGSALVDLLVKTSHSKSCKLRNLRVLRILAVIDLPQVSPLCCPKEPLGILRCCRSWGFAWRLPTWSSSELAWNHRPLRESPSGPAISEVL